MAGRNGDERRVVGDKRHSLRVWLLRLLLLRKGWLAEVGAGALGLGAVFGACAVCVQAWVRGACDANYHRANPAHLLGSLHDGRLWRCFYFFGNS